MQTTSGGSVAFDPAPHSRSDEENNPDDREPEQTFHNQSHDHENKPENQEKTYETQHLYINTPKSLTTHPQPRTRLRRTYGRSTSSAERVARCMRRQRPELDGTASSHLPPWSEQNQPGYAFLCRYHDRSAIAGPRLAACEAQSCPASNRVTGGDQT